MNPQQFREGLIEALAKHAIENGVRLTTIYRELGAKAREIAPKKFWAKHHKGCTHQMRENKRLRAKAQATKALNTDPRRLVGLTPERIRELTNQK